MTDFRLNLVGMKWINNIRLISKLIINSLYIVNCYTYAYSMQFEKNFKYINRS